MQQFNIRQIKSFLNLTSGVLHKSPQTSLCHLPDMFSRNQFMNGSKLILDDREWGGFIDYISKFNLTDIFSETTIKPVKGIQLGMNLSINNKISNKIPKIMFEDNTLYELSNHPVVEFNAYSILQYKLNFTEGEIKNILDNGTRIDNLVLFPHDTDSNILNLIKNYDGILDIFTSDGLADILADEDTQYISPITIVGNFHTQKIIYKNGNTVLLYSHP